MPMLGVFYHLRVIQKILYKRYQCMGWKSWFFDLEIIVQGSTKQGYEEGH